MSIKKDILSTLAYFDIFDYPLKKREIALFIPNSYNDPEFETAMDELLTSSGIYKMDQFYSLQNNYSIIQRRNKGNNKAMKVMVTAEKVASFLSKFPFVQGVAISGSLSKDYADDVSDIDLFLITSKNRLWIARSLLHVVYKIACLFKKQHLFCMNYYIDEEQLEIEEKNIYTATEIVTLIPLQGSVVFEEFFSANSWTKKFLPNNYMRISTAKTIRRIWPRRLVEWMLNNRMGNYIDNYLLRITSKRWEKKTHRKLINKNGLPFGMKTSKHFAKHDPNIFQTKILSLHESKLSALLTQHKVRPINISQR